MKTTMKIILCILLVILAMVSLTAVLGSILPQASAAGETVYLLREYEGRIGIYYPAEAEEPATVTDIRVSGLPLQDRLELAAGIGAEDYAAVIRLLEDFGA